MQSLLRRSYFNISVLIIGTICSLLFEASSLLVDKGEVIRHVPTAHKVVALTIDDGPHSKTTPELLSVLKEKQVRATFFVLGANVALYPEVTKQTIADGHEIACHAYSHKRLNKLTSSEIKSEFERFEKSMQSVGAAKPLFFRPPDGAYNDGLVELAGQYGYTTILWSVDSGDWRRPSAEHVVEAVMRQVKPGSIILMHDGQHPLPTAQAASVIIDKLRTEGYQFVSLSELMRYYEQR